MKKILFIIGLALFSLPGLAELPENFPAGSDFTGHFQVAYIGNGINHMSINIVDAKIGGVKLQAGDEIAVFDGNICAGVLRLTAPFKLASVPASQATDGLPNGYTVGNPITIKFWDDSFGREISTVIMLDFSGLPINPVYIDRGSTFVSLSATMDLDIRIGADNKFYDGTTDASVTTGSVVANGLASEHDVTVNFTDVRFDTKDVGNDKLVTANVSISGTDTGYYTVNPTVTTTANITGKPITVTADAKSKVPGAPDPELTFTFAPELIGSDSFTGSLIRDAGEDPGPYPINLGTLTAGSNYTLIYTGAYLTIRESLVLIKKTLDKGWTWFSLNVSQTDMSLTNVLSSLFPSDGDYIKNQTVSATYYAEVGWFGELDQINPKEMYKIKLSNSDTLKFEGVPVDPSSTPITITAGWNWIGYIPRLAKTVTEALSAFAAVTDDYIKNQTRSATFYEGVGWFGELESLEPLDGYMLKTIDSGTLLYPVPVPGSNPDTRDGKAHLRIKPGIK